MPKVGDQISSGGLGNESDFSSQSRNQLFRISFGRRVNRLIQSAKKDLTQIPQTEIKEEERNTSH